jgi:hypothetical protein
MAYEIPGLMYTLLANADLTTHQYKALVVTSTGTCAVAGANAPQLVGVLQNKPALGERSTIMGNGISIAIAGEPLTPGPVATDASGRFVAAGANPVVGIALEGTGAANVHFPLLRT